MPVVAILMITACTNNWGVNQVSKRVYMSDMGELQVTPFRKRRCLGW